MKLWISCILLASLVAILLPRESDAWLIRRRFWRGLKETAVRVGCGVACAKECSGLLCKGGCALCTGGRKRRSTGGIKDIIPEAGFNIVPLPRDFKSYDYDPRDGVIDYTPEFVTGAGLDGNDPGTRELFDRADLDKDGKLTRAEFRKAPWVFEDEDDVDDNIDDGVEDIGEEK